LLNNPVKRFKRQQVFKGYCYSVVVDEVLWPNGKRLTRDLIVHPGISIWLPLLDRNHAVLIRQYRYGAGRVLWELPAGTIGKNESPLACAKREIEEEIGYRAAKWKKVVTCSASPGYTTEMIHGYIASDLKPVPCRLEHDEIIETHIFSLSEIKRMTDKGSIGDARSLSVLYHFFKGKNGK